jgi:hypothetical protein
MRYGIITITEPPNIERIFKDDGHSRKEYFKVEQNFNTNANQEEQYEKSRRLKSKTEFLCVGNKVTLSLFEIYDENDVLIHSSNNNESDNNSEDEKIVDVEFKEKN